MLGSMHNEGKIVSQDYVLANMWFNITASGGKPEAESNRDNLSKNDTLANCRSTKAC